MLIQFRNCLVFIRVGSRLDVFVQSTDKNLMVPVGGAIVSGFNKDILKSIKENYPGKLKNLSLTFK